MNITTTTTPEERETLLNQIARVRKHIQSPLYPDDPTRYFKRMQQALAAFDQFSTFVMDALWQEMINDSQGQPSAINGGNAA